MLALAQGDAPIGRFNISGIERFGQRVGHELIAHHAVTVFREDGETLEEALHFGLGLKASRCVAFQTFLNDRGQGFIAQQHLALPRRVNMLEADAGDKRPVAVLNPGAHPVAGLLRILLALVLRDGGQQVLNEDGVGIFPELNRRAFKPCARRRNRIAQIEVGLHVPRQPRDIVDQDDMLFAAIGFEVFEHGEHSGAVDQTAGYGFITEHFRYFIAFEPCELAAARFLRAEAVAFLHLRDAGDARVNDGGGGVGFCFGGLSSHGVSPPCMC